VLRRCRFAAGRVPLVLSLSDDEDAVVLFLVLFPFSAKSSVPLRTTVLLLSRGTETSPDNGSSTAPSQSDKLKRRLSVRLLASLPLIFMVVDNVQRIAYWSIVFVSNSRLQQRAPTPID